MSELQKLERELKWTLRDIDKEMTRETPSRIFLFNAHIYKCDLERAIEDAKKRETPEYKVLAAQQEYAETVGSFCGFY